MVSNYNLVESVVNKNTTPKKNKKRGAWMAKKLINKKRVNHMCIFHEKGYKYDLYVKKLSPMSHFGIKLNNKIM